MQLMWKSNMPRRRKILLTMMFGGGIFVMIAGILRCALIIMDPVNGAAQAGSWAVRETFVAAVIGNIPMIYPLFARTISNLKSSSVFRSVLGGSSSGKLSSGDNSHVELGDVKRPSKPARRKPNIMSMGLTTTQGAGDSEEHIVPPNENRPAPISEEKNEGISITTEFTTTQPNSFERPRRSGGPDGGYDAFEPGYIVKISEAPSLPPTAW
jgi:hypothetical protein